MAISQQIAQWIHAARNPPKYLVASLIVSVGGLLNGLDTGTIGPVTTMESFTKTFGELSSAQHGLVVSCLLLAAGFASLFAGALSDTLGRTRAIALGSLLFAIGAALEAAATNLAMFITGRCIVGIGEGSFFSTLVVYACEISPPSQRGVLASTVQLFITLGIMVGYFVCYGSTNIDSSISWRLPLAIQAGISMFLAVTSQLYLPQSPRWLAYKGRKDEASAAWDRLGVSNAEREKDLLQNPVLNDAAPVAEPSSTGNILNRWEKGVQGAARMFRNDTRRQMLLGVFLMSMQQLSGIDGVLYYAPLLFQQAGISSAQASFLASGVSAILIFVSTIPAFLLADKWGRRASTLYGGLIVSTCMLLIGSLYASDSVHASYGVGRWVVIVTIYTFALGYCMTWAVGVKLYASEIQPIATRATVTALAQAANCTTNFLVAFLTPILLSKSSFSVYFIFGGFSILTIGVCILFMPETQGVSLENIGEIFEAHRAKDIRSLHVLKALSRRLGLVSGKGSVSSRLSAGQGSQVGVLVEERQLGMISNDIELADMTPRT